MLVFLLFSSGKFLFAADITFQTGFETSLSRLNQYQGVMECSRRPPPSCPTVLNDLVQDDFKDRAWIIESRAPICNTNLAQARQKRGTLYNNAINSQKLFEQGRFGYLGNYSHSVVRSCIKSNSANEVDQVSKFYYYNARLNEAAAKLTQERVLIAKLLRTEQPPCPSMDVLEAANKVCEQAKNCSSETNLAEFSKKVEKDEEIYYEILKHLKSFPKNCDETEQCKTQRAALSATLMGLIQKNPWFLNESFKDSRRERKTEQRLKDYLTRTDINLRTMQNKFQQTSECIHGMKSDKCGLDDMREVLSYTPDLPEMYVRDRVENQLTTLMTTQSCLEDGSLDRNRTGQIMNDTYINVGLTVATLGLGAIANSARIASAVSYGRAARTIAESLNLSFDIYSAATSAHEAIKACDSNKFSFQFRKLDSAQVCAASGSALSVASRNEGSCIVSSSFAAFGALVTIPGGARVLKLMKEAGYIKTQADVVAQAAANATRTASAAPAATAIAVTHTASVSTTTATASTTAAGARGPRPVADGDLAGATTGRPRTEATRKEDTRTHLPDRRTPSQQSATVAQADAVASKSIAVTTIPNVPSAIKISELQQADGTKKLFYSFPEMLPNGTWVKSTKELPIDPISGGINANFPAGRELFEKIAQEKSGKAYMAFVDVGSLGAVNKTFKAGEEAGDKYLKAVADKIMKNGEGKVTLARLGGDEFGLIIDETDPKKVKALLEKIQADIRLDMAGDARQVFRDEKIVRAEEYKAAIDKILKEKGVVTEADKAAVRARIDELAKIQQPDISIGSTQIGSRDNLPGMLSRAEAQAKAMKTQTALEFGRSAEKYGSSAAPRSRPNPMYRAPVEAPAPSSSWTDLATRPQAPPSAALRDIASTRKEELKRFGSVNLARYEDEAGRSSYRVERFVTDTATGTRRAVTTEIPTRGNTGMLDGVHPESQRLIMEQVGASTDTMLVMPKLSSLKYLNYFESGTKAGDDMLEAVSEVLKRNMRSTDLTFKLNGADFLWSVNKMSAADLAKVEQKLNAELMNNSKVKQILLNEQNAISAKIAEAARARNRDLVFKLNQKLESVKNFKPDLNFRSVSKQEAQAAGSFGNILKIFDEKFK